MKGKKLFFFFGLLCFIYINNTSLLVKHRKCRPLLVAHRGLGQTFSHDGINKNTNTARRICTPEHPYLENTIPSMEAAFRYGADAVELDIKLTKDKQFAVFHDYTLDYRTNAKGSVSDFTMAELKLLDVGYGYTADSGKTWPFRGKGIGLMPSLQEILRLFPGRKFYIHMKSNDPEDGIHLARFLNSLPLQQQQLLTVYGGDKPVTALKEQMPAIRVTSKERIKKCLLQYAVIGWTGYVPHAMRNTELLLPVNYAPYLWGWPHKFLKRMSEVNTMVVLMQGGEYSSGFDDVKDLEKLPVDFCGGIWTNRIDRVGGK